MKIGAYQFAMTGDINKNMESIEKAIKIANKDQVRILIFPECALTGYPPIDIPNVNEIDFELVNKQIKDLEKLARENNLYLFVGTALKKDNLIYNSMLVITPNQGQLLSYDKRALWGWDSENFINGNNIGIYEIEKVKIGVRMCFEVRFPEYFRELYKEKTDLTFIMFCDVAEVDNLNRYDLIKAHIQTRAVETICPILTVNNIHPYQTAPTAIFNHDGNIINELPRNIEGLLIYDYKKSELSFGAKGRQKYNDLLVK